jgi:N-acetyl sugar amidotransferase
MDTTDSEIKFDDQGICNHCHQFETSTSKEWLPNHEGMNKWNLLLAQVKKAGLGQSYDCIIGLSGGLDSSYLAIKAKEWGLRPLVVHVDAGWNSELAVANIEAIVKHCQYDLYTHVVDWSDMRDLQLSYLKAAVSNQDVPQDHIFFSALYHFAIKNKISYILSGGNIATESVLPSSWQGDAMDAINLKAIHKKYGRHKLKTYKTVSFFQYYFWFPFVKKMKVLRPLNYMPYNKEMALKELEATVGYKSYPRKHGESIFTKWFQNHYLPKKFNMDKRRPHLSSLILSGQITRDAAIAKIAEPLYEANELEADITYLCKKLKITRDEYDQLISAHIHHYSDFKNWVGLFKVAKKIQGLILKITGRKLKVSY